MKCDDHGCAFQEDEAGELKLQLPGAIPCRPQTYRRSWDLSQEILGSISVLSHHNIHASKGKEVDLNGVPINLYYFLIYFLAFRKPAFFFLTISRFRVLI